ncbi:MAG: ABC transporter ATP-binding protein [Dehalococcoidia bacterium]
MAEVALDRVEKRFTGKRGAVSALAGLSLRAADGEFLVLVGPSGCGKTTVLRLVAGLEEPTAGAIFIGGRRVDHLPPERRDVAMVFQHYALFGHLSVYDNLAFGLTMRRRPKAEVARLVGEAAELLDLTSMLGRRPAELSGGQQQRVALGRAMVSHPQAFLMDEPLSNLDARLRVQMRAELSRLHRRLGVTTLYVTHDQTEAMTMGSRIAVLNAGVLQQLDSPQALYDTPANLFVAGFIGSPAMSFVEGTVLHQETGPVISTDGLILPLPAHYAAAVAARTGSAVVLGLRPEAVGPHAGGPELSLPVEMVEPVGSDVYVTFRFAGATLTGRFPPGFRPRPGETARATLNLDLAYLFDPATGQAIVGPASRR